MSVYMQSTLELAPAGVHRFMEGMAQAVPILETHGWKLVGAYFQYTGRLHTVIDVWEMEDFNHYERALHAFIADARFPAIKKVLDETVLKETVLLAHAAPYFKPAAGGSKPEKTR